MDNCLSNFVYSKLITSDCHLEGWKQDNDDCWLDSSLYAMFVPLELSVFMSDMLDDIHTTFPDFATSISYYVIF